MSFERQGIADHAKNLASTIQGNLKRSLESIGVDILTGAAPRDALLLRTRLRRPPVSSWAGSRANGA